MFAVEEADGDNRLHLVPTETADADIMAPQGFVRAEQSINMLVAGRVAQVLPLALAWQVELQRMQTDELAIFDGVVRFPQYYEDIGFYLVDLKLGR